MFHCDLDLRTAKGLGNTPNLMVSGSCPLLATDQAKLCLMQIVREGELPGQSHLIFGVGSTGHVTANQLSKPCYANVLYKPPENLDAIALGELRDSCYILLPPNSCVLT